MCVVDAWQTRVDGKCPCLKVCWNITVLLASFLCPSSAVPSRISVYVLARVKAPDYALWRLEAIRASILRLASFSLNGSIHR